jgi:hypothetical protein
MKHMCSHLTESQLTFYDINNKTIVNVRIKGQFQLSHNVLHGFATSNWKLLLFA